MFETSPQLNPFPSDQQGLLVNHLSDLVIPDSKISKKELPLSVAWDVNPIEQLTKYTASPISELSSTKLVIKPTSLVSGKDTPLLSLSGRAIARSLMR